MQPLDAAHILLRADREASVAHAVERFFLLSFVNAWLGKGGPWMLRARGDSRVYLGWSKVITTKPKRKEMCVHRVRDAAECSSGSAV